MNTTTAAPVGRPPGLVEPDRLARDGTAAEVKAKAAEQLNAAKARGQPNDGLAVPADPGALPLHGHPYPTKKVAYWHDAIIDWVVSNPGGSPTDCAKALNRNPIYIATIMRSDFFRARLSVRRAQMRERIDEAIAGKAREAAHDALGLLHDKIRAARENPDRVPLPIVVDATKTLLDAIGFTPTRVGIPPPGQQVNVQVVVTQEQLAAAREKAQRREATLPPLRLVNPSEASDQAKEPEPVDDDA